MTDTQLKTGNWTDGEVATLIAGYNPDKSDVTVDALIEQLGRSKRSVTGKLVSEGVYVAPDKPAPKARDEGPTKKEIMISIGKAGFDTTGLDGATKDALSRLLVLASK